MPFSGCDTGDRKRAAWGCSLDQLCFTSLKEQLRQEERVWVGGSHGKIDANSFLKAKQMKIIFTVPQLLCGFFQTKPEQNAVQITTKIGADQGCGIKGSLLSLAECALGEMSLSPSPALLLHLTATLSMLPFAHPSPLPTCSPGVLERMGSPSARPPQLPVSTSQHKTHRGRKSKTGNRHKP